MWIIRDITKLLHGTTTWNIAMQQAVTFLCHSFTLLFTVVAPSSLWLVMAYSSSAMLVKEPEKCIKLVVLSFLCICRSNLVKGVVPEVSDSDITYRLLNQHSKFSSRKHFPLHSIIFPDVQDEMSKLSGVTSYSSATHIDQMKCI